MTKIDGGICAAKGFKASGTYCGIKKPAVENPNPDYVHKNDICLVACDVLCNTAAVYTQNKVKGAPILVTKDHLAQSGNKAKAIIANSKNANTCNADGVEKAAKMCQLVADEMGLPAEQVLVASTGVIGQVLPIEPIMTAVPTLVKELDYGKNEEAATAIMTTDTVKKEYAVEFQLDGKTCRLGGMAKGSGMIHPNMATMLVYVTTDAKADPADLQKMLSAAVDKSFNMCTVDGDTSTNDSIFLLANGASGVEIKTEEDKKAMADLVLAICTDMARRVASDGEGATHLIEVEAYGLPTEHDARLVAKSIAGSMLFKAAVFGRDANWGRIMAAAGYSGADVDPTRADCIIKSAAGEVQVMKDGFGADFSEELAKKVLTEHDITVIVRFYQGDGEAKAWGCDLTYDYVKINGDYRT